MEVQARETDLIFDDVPEKEVFDLTDFDDFKVTLINDGGQAQIISIEEWKNRRK